MCSTPTNGDVVYQLDDGPDQAKWVYVAEDVIPGVKLTRNFVLVSVHTAIKSDRFRPQRTRRPHRLFDRC